MASFKEKVASVAVEQAVKYARKDFKRNAPRILNLVEKFDVKKVNRSTYAGLHKVMDDPNNNWMKFAEDLICNMDEHVLTKLVPPLMNVAINSYTKRMAAIEKYGCNVPWAILMDPTAACNLKCTGCWAAEYGHTSSLSYDDLARIIKEGKELGTYMYLYTGGEPTMRRKDLMRLCRENPDRGRRARANFSLSHCLYAMPPANFNSVGANPIDDGIGGADHFVNFFIFHDIPRPGPSKLIYDRNGKHIFYVVAEIAEILFRNSMQ